LFVVDKDKTNPQRPAAPENALGIRIPECMVNDVMATDVVTFYGTDDTGEAAQAFERYDLVSAPVIDSQHKLIGRLTVDMMVDVIREESESEVLNLAGLREEEDLFSSVWKSAQNRWPWLALNLCTAFLASRVIGAFEGTIAQIVALAALMPIVSGIGGNTGTQTSTLIIRSLALGQITSGTASRLIVKGIRHRPCSTAWCGAVCWV
jgi:magnesium transporter